jgi:hypothetical protein
MIQGQKTKSIELDFIGRYDKHADYTTRFFDGSYTNDTKLWGKSFGVNFNYLHSIDKCVNLKAGIGYYNLRIDKIGQPTPFNTIAKGRSIGYQDPWGRLPSFATKKYHYNNLNLTVGVNYNKPVFKKMDFIIGGDLTYLYTFSQLYHITYDNIKYRTNNGKTLGFAVNSFLGVSHKFNKDKNYISPKLFIPIYQQLYGDKVFGEDNSVRMTKWLNGIGMSVSIGKYL